jgi:hypothetical protein
MPALHACSHSIYLGININTMDSCNPALQRRKLFNDTTPSTVLPVASSFYQPIAAAYCFASSAMMLGSPAQPSKTILIYIHLNTFSFLYII